MINHYDHVINHPCCFIDSLVKGAEEATVVMPTDAHSTAEPVQPVEQLEDTANNVQLNIEEQNSK